MGLNLGSIVKLVAVYDKKIEKTEKYLEKLKIANIEVIDIGSLESFIKLRAKNRTLIFHCHGFLHLEIASRLKRVGDRIVITVHTYRHYWRFWKFPLTLYLYLRYKKSVDAWHLLCGKSADEFFWFRKHPQNAFIFPLGVEDEFMKSQPTDIECYDIEGRKINWEEGKKKLVYIAYFYSVKRHKFLLESLKDILKDNIVLYLIGDGPLLRDCVQYAKQLGIVENVVFLGRVNRDIVMCALSKTTLAVIPSRSETFGWCLLEPFCMDKPIVTTNVGIAGSLIQDFRNGFVVDVNCGEEEFCNKVKYALEYIQNVDNSSMKNLYRWQTFSANMKQCYNYIMNMQ
jgi:glycosyltransferase involved in cell wall biosynthesis